MARWRGDAWESIFPQSGSFYSNITELDLGVKLTSTSPAHHRNLQVGRVGGLVWGASTRPSLALGPLFSEPAPDTDPRSPIQRAVDACLSRASYGIAYSPGAQSATEHGRFTAALELVEERQLSVAFLYHMALQRNVHNPFEGSGEMRRGGLLWGAVLWGMLEAWWCCWALVWRGVGI